MFNKTVAGFSEVQKKTPAALRTPPNFLREKNAPPGEWQFYSGRAKTRPER
jgi:hypothetical protein